MNYEIILVVQSIWSFTLQKVQKSLYLAGKIRQMILMMMMMMTPRNKRKILKRNSRIHKLIDPDHLDPSTLQRDQKE
jgi:hypothetical protein